MENHPEEEDTLPHQQILFDMKVNLLYAIFNRVSNQINITNFEYMRKQQVIDKK